MNLKNILIISLLSLIFIGCSSTVGVSLGDYDDANNLKVVTADNPRVQAPVLTLVGRNVSGILTLTEDTITGTNYIIIDEGSWAIGDTIQLVMIGRYYKGQVVAINGNNLTMDTPLDWNFTVAGTQAFEFDLNMARDGSVTPLHYPLGPVASNIESYISRIIFHCVDDADGDDTKFCGGPALEKGIIFKYSGARDFNIFNIKTNGDLAKLAYDLTYHDKAGGGLYAVSSRLTFASDSKMGTYLRLSNESYVEFIVQDDLTHIEELTYTIEGFYRLKE